MRSCGDEEEAKDMNREIEEIKSLSFYFSLLSSLLLRDSERAEQMR